MNMRSVAKHLVLKPFVYATVYSATTAALSLALFSAPQLAAAPVAAKGIAILANSCTAFGVGSAHGSFNGAHRLLIQERALVRLLPLGQIFDFLKSKDTKPFNMEVCFHSFAATNARRHSNPNPPYQASKAFADKVKSSLLEPKFIPRFLRPVAGYFVELVLPVSSICAIPEHIDHVTHPPPSRTPCLEEYLCQANFAINSLQLQQQDKSLQGMEAVVQSFILAAASQALVNKKETVVMLGGVAVLVVSCLTCGCAAWLYPQGAVGQ